MVTTLINTSVPDDSKKKIPEKIVLNDTKNKQAQKIIERSLSQHTLQDPESKKLSNAIQSLLIKQNLVDSYFTDHSSGHSIRVSLYCLKALSVLSNQSDIQQKCTDLGDNGFKLLEHAILIAAWCHDTGYYEQFFGLKEPGEKDIRPLSKATHSCFSAVNFNASVKRVAINYFVSRGLDFKKSVILVNEIEDSIRSHNGDKKTMLYHSQISTEAGQVLTNSDQGTRLKQAKWGRPCDLIQVSETGDYVIKPNEAGIEYVESNLSKDSIQFILRFSDNADISQLRLSKVQRTVIRRCIDYLIFEDSLCIDDMKFQKVPADKLEEEEFLHLLQTDIYQRKYFFGLYAILSVSPKLNHGELILEIRTNPETKHLTVMNESGINEPVNSFYANRGKQAYQALKLSHKSPKITCKLK